MFRIKKIESLTHIAEDEKIVSNIEHLRNAAACYLTDNNCKLATEFYINALKEFKELKAPETLSKPFIRQMNNLQLEIIEGLIKTAKALHKQYKDAHSDSLFDDSYELYQNMYANLYGNKNLSLGAQKVLAKQYLKIANHCAKRSDYYKLAELYYTKAADICTANETQHFKDFPFISAKCHYGIAMLYNTTDLKLTRLRGYMEENTLTRDDIRSLYNTTDLTLLTRLKGYMEENPSTRYDIRSLNKQTDTDLMIKNLRIALYELSKANPKIQSYRSTYVKYYSQYEDVLVSTHNEYYLDLIHSRRVLKFLLEPNSNQDLYTNKTCPNGLKFIKLKFAQNKQIFYRYCTEIKKFEYAIELNKMAIATFESMTKSDKSIQALLANTYLDLGEIYFYHSGSIKLAIEAFEAFINIYYTNFTKKDFIIYKFPCTTDLFTKVQSNLIYVAKLLSELQISNNISANLESITNGLTTISKQPKIHINIYERRLFEKKIEENHTAHPHRIYQANNYAASRMLSFYLNKLTLIVDVIQDIDPQSIPLLIQFLNRMIEPNKFQRPHTKPFTKLFKENIHDFIPQFTNLLTKLQLMHTSKDSTEAISTALQSKRGRQELIEQSLPFPTTDNKHATIEEDFRYRNSHSMIQEIDIYLFTLPFTTRHEDLIRLYLERLTYMSQSIYYQIEETQKAYFTLIEKLNKCYHDKLNEHTDYELREVLPEFLIEINAKKQTYLPTLQDISRNKLEQLIQQPENKSQILTMITSQQRFFSADQPKKEEFKEIKTTARQALPWQCIIEENELTQILAKKAKDHKCAPPEIRLRVFWTILTNHPDKPEQVVSSLVKKLFEHDLAFVKHALTTWKANKEISHTALKNIDIFFQRNSIPELISFQQHAYYAFCLSAMMSGTEPSKLEELYNEQLKTMVTGVVHPKGKWSIKTELEQQHDYSKFICHISGNGLTTIPLLNQMTAFHTNLGKCVGIRMVAVACNDKVGFDGIEDSKSFAVFRHDFIHAGFIKYGLQTNRERLNTSFEQLTNLIEAIQQDKVLHSNPTLKNAVDAAFFMWSHELTTSIFVHGLPRKLPSSKLILGGIHASAPQMLLRWGAKFKLIYGLFSQEIATEEGILQSLKLLNPSESQTLNDHERVKKIMEVLDIGYTYLEKNYQHIYPHQNIFKTFSERVTFSVYKLLKLKQDTHHDATPMNTTYKKQ